jgi:hypothetical protein
MFRSILIAAALLSAAAPAFADNHRNKGGRNDHHDNRGNDKRGNNWNNNWNHGRDYHYDRRRSTANLGIGIILGSALYAGSRSYGYGYDDYRYAEPVYSNSWGLYPGRCRWDREFAYWRGRPADVEVQRCADGYGNAYIVAGAQRLWRYR